MALNYREQDFVEEVSRVTDGRGVDVILDNMGAKYLPRNVESLATSGRLVIIGMQGGIKGELDISALLKRRGRDRDFAAGAPDGGEVGDLCGRTRARLAVGRAGPDPYPGQRDLRPRGRRRGAPSARGWREHREDRAHDQRLVLGA